MGRLRNQKVAVAGGTHGIGLGMARALLEEGARLSICGLTEPDEAVRKELTGLGECHFVAADLGDASGARRFVGEADDALDGLDHLVCNAGTWADSDFLSLTEEQFHKTMNLNVGGYFFCSQEFVRRVGKRNWDASITCTGSINSIQAEKNSVLYDTSKGAILMLVRTMALTLSDWKIRVNGIGPGLIRTPLNENSLSDPNEVALVEAQIPAGRIGRPEDIGGTAVYLCSDMSAYVTGQMIYVDGGIMVNQMSHGDTFGAFQND